MTEWSRRRALHAVATTGLVTLAGCGEAATGPHDPPEPRERVTDVETLLARNEGGDPLIVTAGEGGETNPDDRNVSLMEHLTDGESLDEYRFPADAGGAEVESFVTATGFASESVYLLQRHIGACYVPRLVSVYREDDGVDANFCRALRPADVACDAETRHVFAVAIRLPFPGDGFSSVGSGSGSGCERRPTIPLDGGEGS